MRGTSLNARGPVRSRPLPGPRARQRGDCRDQPLKEWTRRGGSVNAFNITSRTISGQATSYAHNNANELSQAGSRSFTYDDAGNLCGEGTGEVARCNPATQTGQRYSYNNRNQTQSITPAGGSAIAFDYAGESQTERTWKGDLEFTDNLLGLGMQDPQGPTDPTFFNRNADTGEALSMRTPGGRYYYVTDGLGSIVALTDSAGNLVTRYRYEPHGQAVGTPSGPANPIRFQNQYLDTETGLYKMGARYYDPSVMRWTQKDPLNLFQDPRQGNRYAFVGGDPVNRVDPSGMDYCGVNADIQEAILPGFLQSTPLVCTPGYAEQVQERATACAIGAVGGAYAFPGDKAVPVYTVAKATAGCLTGLLAVGG